jgi:hypothetical protein
LIGQQELGTSTKIFRAGPVIWIEFIGSGDDGFLARACPLNHRFATPVEVGVCLSLGDGKYYSRVLIAGQQECDVKRYGLKHTGIIRQLIVETSRETMKQFAQK